MGNGWGNSGNRVSEARDRYSNTVPYKEHEQKTKIMASGPITSWEMDGETVQTVSDFIFVAPKSLQMVTAAMKLKDAYPLEGKL